jgi:hypothetical protein
MRRYSPSEVPRDRIRRARSCGCNGGSHRRRHAEVAAACLPDQTGARRVLRRGRLFIQQRPHRPPRPTRVALLGPTTVEPFRTRQLPCIACNDQSAQPPPERTRRARSTPTSALQRLRVSANRLKGHDDPRRPLPQNRSRSSSSAAGEGNLEPDHRRESPKIAARSGAKSRLACSRYSPCSITSRTCALSAASSVSVRGSGSSSASTASWNAPRLQPAPTEARCGGARLDNRFGKTAARAHRASSYAGTFPSRRFDSVELGAVAPVRVSDEWAIDEVAPEAAQAGFGGLRRFGVCVLERVHLRAFLE